MILFFLSPSLLSQAWVLHKRKHEQYNGLTLFTGPSNVAVNVALEKACQYPIVQSKGIRVVRMLRRQLERVFNPVMYALALDRSATGKIGDLIEAAKQNADTKDKREFDLYEHHQAFFMHTLARDPSLAGEEAIMLNEVEAQIQGLYDKDVSELEPLKKKYKEALERAEAAVLRRADVLFATTTQSTSKRVRRIAVFLCAEGQEQYEQFRYSAVIVDEASMLTEPDLVSTISRAIDRVALVGDHLQLQPVVRSLGARDANAGRRMRQEPYPHGLGRSLFERVYKPLHVAGSGHTVMLQEQYRMHDDICQVCPGGTRIIVAAFSTFVCKFFLTNFSGTIL